MKRNKKLQIFVDSKKATRVRLVAGNGRKINVTEGYKNPSYAKELAKQLQKFGGRGTKIEDLTKKRKS
ncbi:MAG: hypothetical protein UV55_C0023G0008 [Candidatus Gottesmanbacteria bacterium GW2011_GWC1_43_10]|nr:MAG: hypothetical protein UV55_C0023G0008 [Candidatus Gottesmanbacteria bacterium GW2011_GWC1_43_10]